MADNVIASAAIGVGATFATDQNPGDSVHWPLTKLAWGPLNTFTVLDTGGSALPIQDGGNSITVDGTFWQATQPVSGTITANLGTIAGVSTAAKQPALGTAGTASSDVLTVQGITSMTPLLATLSGTNNIATVTTVTGITNVVHVDDNSGSLTVDGSVTVTQATGTNLHTVVDSGTVTTVSAVTAITNALPAGTNNIGQTQNVPGTTGGLSYSAFVSANSNNKTTPKSAAGQVYFISIQNIQSVPVYLKIFDKTSANVTAGTTDCDYQFMCPANATAANGTGVVFSFDPGLNHANAITYLLTTGIGTHDNTSVAASSQVVVIGYK